MQHGPKLQTLSDERCEALARLVATQRVVGLSQPMACDDRAALCQMVEALAAGRGEIVRIEVVQNL